MAAPDCRKAGDLDRFCLTVTSSFCCPMAADCEAREFTNFVGKKYQSKARARNRAHWLGKAKRPLLAQSRHAQCAGKGPLLRAKRTVTNRCLPISIYEYTALVAH
jgi:hypothetical protein